MRESSERQAGAAGTAIHGPIAEAIEAARADILDLSHRIHANPEPAYEEHRGTKQ